MSLSSCDAVVPSLGVVGEVHFVGHPVRTRVRQALFQMLDLNVGPMSCHVLLESEAMRWRRNLPVSGS